MSAPTMEDHAAKVVKDAPPLSAEQKARLARLLRINNTEGVAR
jgi:demethoxyubiquinone hydroxylase (CLK1/Coq7/Cat5 family)